MKKNIAIAIVVPAVLVLLAALTLLPQTRPPAHPYRVIKTISVGGDDGWDYLVVDASARRVYVSHGSHVVVMDADSYAVVGDIPDTQGVHGIALAEDLGRGFVSDGHANTATIFDLKSLQTIGTVKTGTNPDAIVYDPASKRVFTMNGRSGDATTIDAATGNVLGTLALGGKPEFAAADGRGSIFVNIEDKSEIVEFDARKLTLTHRWPLGPCEEPSGLAIDRKSRRLFAGCGNKVMAVVNADTGQVIATPAIGEGVDANAFDAETKLAFASTAEGTLNVVREETPSKFTVVQNVPTKKSARTMGLDLKTHNIFLPAAEFDPPAPGERRGKMKPGTFVILVVAQ
jgi:DNA-binding beta-propeller fold protein YncE